MAVIDSGIGGLSVLNKLAQTFKGERFIYFGDNENAPYGNKSVDQLYSLAQKSVSEVKRYQIKALVLGCNTLSTNLFSEISSWANVPTFGVFPPVDYVVGKFSKIALLSTVRTAERYKFIPDLDVFAFKNLAFDIENNTDDFSKVDFLSHFTKIDLRKSKNTRYDAIILGCTHYNFIKKQIVDHFQPLFVLSGEDKLIFELKKFGLDIKSLGKHYRNRVLFLGKSAQFNKNVCVKSGWRW